jgi:hypothetical protein
MQLSPTSCHFILLQSKYSPQYPIRRHPQSMIHPHRATSKIMVSHFLIFTLNVDIFLERFCVMRKSVIFFFCFARFNLYMFCIIL